MITGPGGSAKRQASAAAAQQAKTLAQQEAVQNRAQLREDNRETDISGQLAAQRRSVVARRRGRGGLAYDGLKTTFGG